MGKPYVRHQADINDKGQSIPMHFTCTKCEFTTEQKHLMKQHAEQHPKK